MGAVKELMVARLERMSARLTEIAETMGQDWTDEQTTHLSNTFEQSIYLANTAIENGETFQIIRYLGSLVAMCESFYALYSVSEAEPAWELATAFRNISHEVNGMIEQVIGA